MEMHSAFERLKACPPVLPHATAELAPMLTLFSRSKLRERFSQSVPGADAKGQSSVVGFSFHSRELARDPCPEVR
eukprot:scaffold1130_cov195-Pinguiococcus_pyrenoidosus.AAC.105